MTAVVALASGNGGNAKFLYAALRLGVVARFDLTVIADRECEALTFARRVGLPCALISYSQSERSELEGVLHRISPDAVITTWHKIIDVQTVRQLRGRMINLHYSLLPAFAGAIGMKPLLMAYERGCRFAGPSCHLVDEGVDTGRVLAQAVFETRIKLEDAIQLMFRLGCLALLSGLQKVTGLAVYKAAPDLLLDLGPTPVMLAPHWSSVPSSTSGANVIEQLWTETAAL